MLRYGVHWRRRRSNVSISALSDRGLLHHSVRAARCQHEVSISALSDRGLLQEQYYLTQNGQRCFNIRSFGSWIASKQVAPTLAYIFEFQYPLFRIVDCFNAANTTPAKSLNVSISALSDRGLLRMAAKCSTIYPGVSISALSDRGLLRKSIDRIIKRIAKFQYPLFRIVDCFLYYSQDGKCANCVSISALSDRGLLLDGAGVPV